MRSISTSRMAAFAILIFFGGTLFSAAETGLWIARFSGAEAGGLPSEWREHEFPKIPRHTGYILVADGERTVLMAKSRGSASALVRKVKVDPSRYPYLEWSWKIEEPVGEARWGVKEGDDFAARLFVIFEKDGGPLGFFSKVVTGLAGGFYGRALNYVWANEAEPGTLSPSPYTGDVMMIALESGRERSGTWVKERRHLVDDFQAAFGRKPGKVVALAIMTDCDQTNRPCTAYYGDIILRSSFQQTMDATLSRLPRKSLVPRKQSHFELSEYPLGILGAFQFGESSEKM